MADGEDWLLRPAIEGICGYESLVNGVLSLEDVAVMNEALDVKFENEARLREHAERDQR
ncbi:DUF6889 family protein [Herbaspirillum huttiense]|uniref:DUF6889 family protein n=1 Tax=Herbaspirillum huttiense TaxID=863372 RepID=UPI0031D7B92A